MSGQRREKVNEGRRINTVGGSGMERGESKVRNKRKWEKKRSKGVRRGISLSEFVEEGMSKARAIDCEERRETAKHEQINCWFLLKED